MKRLAAACTILALLAGCAVDPDHPEQDSCALEPHPDYGFIIYDVLFLPVYLLYGATCESIHALDRHGAFDSAPEGTLDGGVYHAADGSFSVVPPPGLGIREEYYPQLDYVLFAPRLVKGPVYAVSVQLALDSSYASMPLDQFTTVALKDARFQAQLAAGIPLKELRRETTTIAGRPALSIVYSQTPTGAARPTAYYLLYFMKTKHRSAVLSIAWPGDCPKCGTGPDADMRAMDPALQAFLGSFVLGGTSDDYR